MCAKIVETSQFPWPDTPLPDSPESESLPVGAPDVGQPIHLVNRPLSEDEEARREHILTLRKHSVRLRAPRIGDAALRRRVNTLPPNIDHRIRRL